MKNQIFVVGLPGSGKTTLAEKLSKRINAVHINADYVRMYITNHLGFSREDRIEQAKKIKNLANMVTNSNHIAVVDFVCPFKETRKIIKDDNSFIIWMDKNFVERGYEDTNKMFENLNKDEYDIKYTDINCLICNKDDHIIDYIIKEVFDNGL